MTPIQENTPIQSIITVLQNGDRQARLRAVEILGERGDPAAVDPLIEVLDEGSMVSDLAGRSLLKIGPLALGALLSAFENGNSFLRMRLFGLIVKIDDPRVQEFLLQQLQHGDAYFRMMSAQALGAIHALPVQSSLVKALSDVDGQVRYAAAGALDALSWTPEDTGDRAKYELAKGWFDRKPMDRPSEPEAQESVPEIPSQETINSSPPNPDQAPEVFVGQPVSPAIEEVSKQLPESVASEPLSSSQTPKRFIPETPSRINVTTDDLVPVKPVSEEMIRVLGADLQSKDVEVRVAAAESLGKIPDPSSTKLLIGALADSQWRVRWTVVRMLADLDDAAGISPLIGMLKDPDSLVRQTAAEALGIIGDTSALQPLLELTKDEESLVRKAAVDALGHLGNTDTLPPLKHLARDDDDDNIRRAAKDAIDKLS